MKTAAGTECSAQTSLNSEYHQHGQYDRSGGLGLIGLLTAALVFGILALEN